MKRFYKIIVWLEVILFVLSLELVSLNRDLMIWILPLFFVAFLFGLWWINGKRLSKKFFNTVSSPTIFIISATLFFIFLVPQVAWFRHLYIVFIGVLLFLFLYNLSELVFEPSIHRLFAIENLSSHFNLLSVFLLFSSFYTFMFFPTIVFWLTEFLVIGVMILLMHHNFWANKINNPKKRFFIMISALILAELYLALSFLPTGFYVNGIILTVIYYIISEISRVYLLEKLDRKFVQNKITIAVIVLVLIFITTRWN